MESREAKYGSSSFGLNPLCIDAGRRSWGTGTLRADPERHKVRTREITLWRAAACSPVRYDGEPRGQVRQLKRRAQPVVY